MCLSSWREKAPVPLLLLLLATLWSWMLLQEAGVGCCFLCCSRAFLGSWLSQHGRGSISWAPPLLSPQPHLLCVFWSIHLQVYGDADLCGALVCGTEEPLLKCRCFYWLRDLNGRIKGCVSCDYDTGIAQSIRCLLVRTFSSFTFKVLIDTDTLSTICCWALSVPFSSLVLCELMNFFSVTFYFFHFVFCICHRVFVYGCLEVHI